MLKPNIILELKVNIKIFMNKIIQQQHSILFKILN